MYSVNVKVRGNLETIETFKMDNCDKDFFSFLRLTFALRRDLQLLGFTEADRLICENLCVFLIIAHLGRSRSLRLIHGL